MMKFTKILCPTDFSPCAEAALPVAFALARDYGAKVLFVYVRPFPVTAVGEFGAIMPEPAESEAELKARMRRMVPTDFPGTVEFQVRDGDAVEEILNTAEAQKCDLIVMATHGRSGLGRVLVGSVAESLLRKAPCPVLTVKPNPVVAAPEAPAFRGRDSEPNVNVNELVTVCSVGNLVEAEVIQNGLKGERIPSFLEGAEQAGMAGMLGIPIKVQVRAADFDRANKFIQSREALRV